MSGRGLLSGALIVLLSSSAFASGSPIQQSTTAPSAKRRVDPYAKLFQQPAIEQTARARQRAQAAVDAARPRVVCGMTLIPANPTVDPKMSVEPKRDSTRYTIRAIEPPVCWQR